LSGPDTPSAQPQNRGRDAPSSRAGPVGLILRNPGDAVYGTIAVGALLAAESARTETYPETVAAVVITLFLYWLAHSYAELVERRLEDETKLTLSRALDTLMTELPILLGAAVPLLTLLVWWAAGASLSSAVLAAVWTSAAIIVAIEVVAGLHARLKGRELLFQILLGAAVGLLIIALRVLLH
jgi:hypothetical protein